MTELTIWHNPRCSKSRQTLAIIEANGISPKIVRYLEESPNAAQIKTALEQLGFEGPRDIMRTGEAIYKELGLKTVSDPKALIAAMASHPILIERPIVSNGSQAVIGRPPESVKSLF